MILYGGKHERQESSNENRKYQLFGSGFDLAGVRPVPGGTGSIRFWLPCFYRKSSQRAG